MATPPLMEALSNSSFRLICPWHRGQRVTSTPVILTSDSCHVSDGAGSGSATPRRVRQISDTSSGSYCSTDRSGVSHEQSGKTWSKNLLMNSKASRVMILCLFASA